MFRSPSPAGPQLRRARLPRPVQAAAGQFGTAGFSPPRQAAGSSMDDARFAAQPSEMQFGRTAARGDACRLTVVRLSDPVTTAAAPANDPKPPQFAEDRFEHRCSLSSINHQSGKTGTAGEGSCREGEQRPVARLRVAPQRRLNTCETHRTENSPAIGAPGSVVNRAQAACRRCLARIRQLPAHRADLAFLKQFVRRQFGPTRHSRCSQQLADG